jgi:hypothetical protein
MSASLPSDGNSLWHVHLENLDGIAALMVLYLDRKACTIVRCGR